MQKPTASLAHIADDIERLNKLRERTVIEAFSTLEQHYERLAQYLLQETGDRRRAAHWMAKHQRVFAGRTAYQILADGDEEPIWDELARSNRSASCISCLRATL